MSIISIMNSIYIKKKEIILVILIQYITSLISIFLILLYIPKEQSLKIFTEEYKHIWIYCFITAIFGLLSWIQYYHSTSMLGPSITDGIYNSVKLVSIVLISIYILKNCKLNSKLIYGIIFIILGIYCLKDYGKYV